MPCPHEIKTRIEVAFDQLHTLAVTFAPPDATPPSEIEYYADTPTEKTVETVEDMDDASPVFGDLMVHLATLGDLYGKVEEVQMEREGARHIAEQVMSGGVEFGGFEVVGLGDIDIENADPEEYDEPLRSIIQQKQERAESESGGGDLDGGTNIPIDGEDENE